MTTGKSIAAISGRRRAASPIRASTEADITGIHNWLKLEEAAAVTDKNWELTLQAHQQAKLLVYVDRQSQVAVGYQWGALLEPGILQVRSDMRHQGIGRKLVQHRITQARRQNQGILYIQCKPRSSIPFWRRMGFTLLEDKDSVRQYAYRLLHRARPLPPGGEPVEVSIRFYPEEAKWKADTAPFMTASPPACVYPEGHVRLGERVYGLSRFPNTRDVVVEVIVNGQRRYRDKAKYDAAANVGLQRCRNGYFIDQIPTAPPSIA